MSGQGQRGLPGAAPGVTEPRVTVRSMGPVEMKIYLAVSGVVMHCFGRQSALIIDGDYTPVVLLERGLRPPGGEDLQKGDALVLDPRTVVVNPETGVITYSPREPGNIQLPKWVYTWLDEHPEWPGVLDL